MKTYKKILSIATLFTSSIAFAATYTYSYDETEGTVTVVVTTESGELKTYTYALNAGYTTPSSTTTISTASETYDYYLESSSLTQAINNTTTGTTINGVFSENTKLTQQGGIILNSSGIDEINGLFVGNTSSANGTAIRNTNNTSPTISAINADFIGNTSSAAGGAIVNAANATITTLTGDFIGNTGTTGGAIYNAGSIGEAAVSNDDGSISYTGITGNFIDNSGSTGGAIFTMAGTIYYIKGDFINNTGTAGGAIYVGNDNNNGYIGDIYGDFISNSSTGIGGAIYILRGSISSITGDFITNTSGSTSGAIYNKGTIGTSTTTESVTTYTGISGNFIGNYAKGAGGAIVNDGIIYSINGDFVANTSASTNQYWGGAIFNGNGDTIYSLSGNFIGNSSTTSSANYSAQGGAIHNNGGTIYLNSSSKDTIQFTGNTADGASSAIHNTGTIYFDANDSSSIIVNDAISGSSGKININNQGGTSTVAFNNAVSGNTITVSAGTLELGSYAGTSNLYQDFYGSNYIAILNDYYSDYDLSSTSYSSVSDYVAATFGAVEVDASSANISSALTIGANATLSLAVLASNESNEDTVNNIIISSLTLDTGSSVALDLSGVFGSFDLSVSYFADLLAYFDSDFESSLLTVIFADSEISSTVSTGSYEIDNVTYTYVIEDDESNEILAAFNVTNDSSTITIKGFSNVAVPEPSTYAMILGALALGFAYYRRRKI